MSAAGHCTRWPLPVQALSVYYGLALTAIEAAFQTLTRMKNDRKTQCNRGILRRRIVPRATPRPHPVPDASACLRGHSSCALDKRHSVSRSSRRWPGNSWRPDRCQRPPEGENIYSCDAGYRPYGAFGNPSCQQGLDDLRQRHVDFKAIPPGIDTTTAMARMLYGQLAVFTEFSREQSRESTKAGMEPALKCGKHIGRSRKLTTKQIAYARRQFSAKRDTITHMATSYGVAPVTLSSALR